MLKPVLYGLLCALAASGALALEPVRRDAARRAALQPLEQSATACFAETVGNNPAALAHARAGRWYEAAGVIGFLCRPEVDAMARAHDDLYGRGAGGRYFTGPYTRHLGQELAERLKPLLETKTVAHAEPRQEVEASVETVAAAH